MAVVVTLEVVEVDEHHRRLAGMHRKRGAKRGSVEQLGEGIGLCDLAQQRTLLLQLGDQPGRDLCHQDPHDCGCHHYGQRLGENHSSAHDECHDAERKDHQRAPARLGEADVDER